MPRTIDRVRQSDFRSLSSSRRITTTRVTSFNGSGHLSHRTRSRSSIAWSKTVAVEMSFVLHTPIDISVSDEINTRIRIDQRIKRFRSGREPPQNGHPRLARTTLLVGIGISVRPMVLAFVLPGNAGSAIPIAATFAVGRYARGDQPLLDGHLAGEGDRRSLLGRPLASGWRAFASHFVLLAVFMVVSGVE